MSKIKKEIDLSELPKRGKHIDWKNSIGCKCMFVYDDINGEVDIIGYDVNEKSVIFNYKSKIDKIKRDSFSKCEFGKILGKRTNEFKIDIGTIFKDDKRDMIITDREYRKDKNGRNRKWYKYTCNKCG